ncbi:hypothetical protein [Falsiroseomonas bella]|nr:hypothetical protein [Falsiroseomonas bella]
MRLPFRIWLVGAASNLIAVTIGNIGGGATLSEGVDWLLYSPPRP